jgi:serine phosphatase RsbU (regulator of sigma subunit)
MMARAPRIRRAQVADTAAAPQPKQGVFLQVLPFAVIACVALVDLLAGPGLGFLPVLSLAPALAAVSWQPLQTAVIGVIALICGVAMGYYDQIAGTGREMVTLSAIAGVTLAGALASAGRRRRERELADFQVIADAAQQILLRPMPARLPPADMAVRYVSAAALARIGGDLYEAISVDGGIRVIVGDVLGKGLPAARTAAVVLGAFRESAYDAADLTQIAARIEASLQHQGAQEEFVTAVIAQISSDGRHLDLVNCGHPPPLLVRDGEVTTVEPAQQGLPLGLAFLTPRVREVTAVTLKQGDRLLFYTDGIAEARDKQGTFYPLERSGAILGQPDLGTALDGLITDVLRHVGHSLQDDAALLLVGL